MISLKPLISEDEIARRVDAIAQGIAVDMQSASTIMVGVMNGSVVFLSDLMRRLYHHGLCIDVDFITVSSYGADTQSSGSVCVIQDIRMDITGKTALLVDDIMDTGKTLEKISDLLYRKGAVKVATCVLLDKPRKRVTGGAPDYAGFVIEDKFVVGYGLDAGGRHRCLPYIAELG